MLKLLYGVLACFALALVIGLIMHMVLGPRVIEVPVHDGVMVCGTGMEDDYAMGVDFTADADGVAYVQAYCSPTPH